MTRPPIKRGDVWWISLDPTQGSEIKKTRPCLILSNDILNNLRKTVVVIPLSTAAKPHPPITVELICQNESAVAIIDQIRAVGKHRLKNKIESISKKELDKIINALATILEIP
ncbi:MAG: type II toxin-antitoxin system PemK/MazF family toxin [Calditrichia bacterium]|nr:type II toxin-antitoxin system PemK/MazF family toxin [Calditrichia bacterium]